MKFQLSTPLTGLKLVVIDCETTGLDISRDRIIQLAAFKLSGGEIDRELPFDVLINPGISIPESSTAIHGITTEDVKLSKRFDEYSEPLLDFVSAGPVLGHNIDFDIEMLKREFSLLGQQWPALPTLDTMLLARVANPFLPNYSLEVIASWLGIEIHNRHTARGDAKATAKVYFALLPMLRKQGIRTVADALRAGAEIAKRRPDQAADIFSETTNQYDDGILGRAIERIDSFPFQHRVGDVMSSPPLIVAPETNPGALAQLLSDQNKSAAFVDLRDEQNRYGIVTERDLMRLLIESADKQIQSVEELANSPLLTIEQSAFVFKALGRMSSASIRHLGVTDENGEIVGALTSGDLLGLRAGDAVTMSVSFDNAPDIAALAQIWGRLPLVAQSLLDESVAVGQIAEVLSEQLASLTRRAAVLAEKKMRDGGRGDPPAQYAVLLLGSGGRGESMLVPDQDNAIIFDSDDDDVRQWFLELGIIMSDILDEVGVPYCRGGVMASNSAWCRSLSDWKQTIHDWLARADWKDLCYVDIFYDFSVVHGNVPLATAIREYAYSVAASAPGFIRQLSALATMYNPPIGFMGNLKTENGRVDLKHGGTLSIVCGARVLALRHKIVEVNTGSRLRRAAEAGVASKEDLSDVAHGLHTLLHNVLEQQLLDFQAGIPASNNIDPKRLSKRRRSEVKQALEMVEVIQTAVGDPMAFG